MRAQNERRNERTRTSSIFHSFARLILVFFLCRLL